MITKNCVCSNCVKILPKNKLNKWSESISHLLSCLARFIQLPFKSKSAFSYIHSFLDNQQNINRCDDLSSSQSAFCFLCPDPKISLLFHITNFLTKIWDFTNILFNIYSLSPYLLAQNASWNISYTLSL